MISLWHLTFIMPSTVTARRCCVATVTTFLQTNVNRLNKFNVKLNFDNLKKNKTQILAFYV